MGLTPELLRELNAPQFEDSETARRYLESQAWPDGPVCAHCGQQERIYTLKSRPGLYSCGGCRGQTTVTVKTVFHRTKVPLHKWLQVTAALEKVPCTLFEIRDALDIAYKTAWRMRGIIRPDIKYAGKATGGRQALCYPFMQPTKRQMPDHELLRLINATVPHTIPEDRRADICQELAISILIGDIETPDLGASWETAMKKVYKMHPTKWAPLSLDAPIGDSDLTLMDTLSTEDSIWNRI